MPYTVIIQPSNIQFTAEPTETILAAALTADIELPHGCQGGACGTCMVSKIEGDTRYPDETPPALDDTDIEQGKILCCQAFACSDVVLEIRSIGVHKENILTLPTRVLDKTITDKGTLLLRLKLPGHQTFPDYISGQNIELLAGAGKVSLASRLPDTLTNTIELEIAANAEDSFNSYLFDNLAKGEMLRIRGPV